MTKSLRVPGVCCCASLIVCILVGARLLAAGAPAAPPKFEWNAMLSDWHVLGPFPKVDENSDELDRVLAPNETQLHPDSPLNLGGKSYDWKQSHAPVINFLRAFDVNGAASRNLLAYAYTEFTSDSAQDVLLGLQHDDGAAVWLNGIEVFRSKENAGSSLDQDVVKVSLKAGTNRLLAKVSQYYGAWEFGARLRPTSLETPLISFEFNARGITGDVSRLPQIRVSLLDRTGKELSTLHVGGGRNKKGGYSYTAFAPKPTSDPDSVQIRFEAPGFTPFDKSYPWSDVSAGKISIRPKLATPLRGKVVDAASGAPVKIAALHLDPGGQKESVQEDGAFEFKTYNPLVQTVDVAAPGYEPRTVMVPWPPDGQWSIKLSRGGHTLRGQVLDAAGKPVEGAKISAYGGNRNINLFTDKDGRFEAFDIASATTSLYPTVTCSGYIAKDGFTLNLNPNGPTEVEWRLDSGAVITGRVVAKDDGRPIKGIMITAGDDRFTSNRVNPETQTDADGRYKLTGAKIGANRLHAFSDDFAPAMQTVNTSSSAGVSADFQLEVGATVTGRVTDPNGKPVPDVNLITDTWNDSRMFHRERKTDAAGKFEFQHMPSTPVKTDLLKQGYVSERQQELVGGQHYELTLSPIVDRAIHLKLSDTGKSPQSITMQLGYQWQGQPEVSWQDMRYERVAKYDSSDGRVHIRDDETSNAKRLLRIRAEGYADSVVTLPSGSKDAVPQELTLEKSQTIDARVVDADSGAPLPDVTVALVSAQDRLRMDQYVDFSQHNRALENFSGVHAVTASGGTFRLPALPKNDASDLVLFRKDGGFLYVPGAAALFTSPDLKIPFPSAGTLSGTMSAGGQPLTGEQIHLSWMPPANPQNPWNFPFGYGGQISTDQDGHFKFDGLGPGRYQLARMKSMKDPSGRMTMSTYLTQEEIVVLPGQAIVHDFELPTDCIVTGQVVGADGKPAANCMVSARGIANGGQAADMAQSDADGYFTLTYLAPGSYNLSAQQYEGSPNRGFMPGPMANKSIRVQKGISPTIKIKLQPRNQLAAGGAFGARPAPNGKNVGALAPDFSGKFFEHDQSFTLSDQIGKVVVVHFFMGSMPSANGASSQFQKIYAKYKDNPGVTFIAVALDADAASLRSVIKKQQLDFPILYESREASERIALSFGLRGLPMTVIVDRDGKIAGESTREEDFTTALETSLKAKAPDASKRQKPERLVIKFTLDNEPSSPPGTKITLKAVDAKGATVREDTMQLAGQSSQMVWSYPTLTEGGEIHATADADGCPKQEEVISNPKPNAEVTFKFTSPRLISGRVAATDGATPVAGVKVTAYRNDGNRRTATTDDDGQFKISVFPGAYFLIFEGTDKFAPITSNREEIDVDVDEDPQPVNLEACTTITVTGTVKDLDGKPVAGVQVRSTANAKPARTDGRGHFELPGVASQGQVIIVATNPPLFAQTVLNDIDPEQPIDLTLQPQNMIGQQQPAGLTGKMPKLELHNVIHDEPVDWRPAPDSDSLVAFCSFWHPSGRKLAQRAEKWADAHHAYVVIVSTDWSLADARRRWDSLGLKPAGIRSPLYAGPGGLEIATDWKLNSAAQAYLISPQGNILKPIAVEDMQ